MDKHKHGKYDEVQAGQGFGQSLVVSGQSAEAVRPTEAALDHSATWQQDKAIFHFWQFDYLKLDSFVQRCLCRFLVGIALIGKCDLDRLACGHPDLPGTPAAVAPSVVSFTASEGISAASDVIIGATHPHQLARADFLNRDAAFSITEDDGTTGKFSGFIEHLSTIQTSNDEVTHAFLLKSHVGRLAIAGQWLYRVKGFHDDDDFLYLMRDFLSWVLSGGEHSLASDQLSCFLRASCRATARREPLSAS